MTNPSRHASDLLAHPHEKEPAVCLLPAGVWFSWTDTVTGDPYRYSDVRQYGSAAWGYDCDETYNMLPAYFSSPAEMARAEAAFKALKSDFDSNPYWFGLT